ncbi:TetR/AcrR family transcriptional regulator [Neobacillus niacini]|uniref:TetR/AcrR family transcriptional regulator n=1 Tax=Neobacillus niacini TaxID=86668 RepID=UPI002FFFFD1E
MKQKIVDASIHLFDENGFKSTSIKDIVDYIGVTKGTFYYYFNSKEELLKDIHLDYIEDLINKQEEILVDSSINCTNKQFEIVYMFIKNIRTNRRSARIFIREIRHLSEVNGEEIRDKQNKFRENIQLLLESGIKNGEMKADCRADILTFGILGMTNWSYYWFNPNGEVSVKKLAEIDVDLILNGINKSKYTIG